MQDSQYEPQDGASTDGDYGDRPENREPAGADGQGPERLERAKDREDRERGNRQQGRFDGCAHLAHRRLSITFWARKMASPAQRR